MLRLLTRTPAQMEAFWNGSELARKVIAELDLAAAIHIAETSQPNETLEGFIAHINAVITAEEA